jgi:hypothetical protein
MSIEAVVSRISVIAQAQQQLASPIGSSASAGTIGALLGGTSASGAQPVGSVATTSAATNFASALASAQGATPSAATTAATGASAVDPGAVIPQASWNPQSKPIAGWIAPVLQWASEHGWTGAVTSGYRSYSEQASINASGAFSAPAGKSNHETTQYPGGAVDVTNPGQLLQVLKGYTGPYKLVGGVLGPADPEHFSATGH